MGKRYRFCKVFTKSISNLSFWSADDYLKEVDDSVSINLLIRENNSIGFIVVRPIMN